MKNLVIVLLALLPFVGISQVSIGAECGSVSWVTASEKNSSYFKIEPSTNGINWNDIRYEDDNIEKIFIK